VITQTDESGIPIAITTLAQGQPTTTNRQPQTGRRFHFVTRGAAGPPTKRKGTRRTMAEILGAEVPFQSMIDVPA
jgi:hypothetical protein